MTGLEFSHGIWNSPGGYYTYQYAGGGGGGSASAGAPGGQGGNGTTSGGGSGGAGSGAGGGGGHFAVGQNGSFPGGGDGGASGAAGGNGASGQIVITYTPVYCGNVVWSASGGGSWGTLTTNFGTNWGGVGYGSPGLNPSFPDIATLGNSVASGTVAVTLDGATPYLAALTFSNSNASYTLAAGSGGTVHLNGGAAGAALTDSAGSHAITAPVALDTSTVATVTNLGDTLAISGPISGSGGLTTSGAGTLVISGPGAVNGGVTTTGAGTLVISSAVAVNGGITTTGAGTVLISGAINGEVTTSGAGTALISGAISGSDGVTVAGPGALVLTAGNSYIGGTTISAGTLQLGNGGTTGTVLGGITNNGTLKVPHPKATLD